MNKKAILTITALMFTGGIQSAFACTPIDNETAITSPGQYCLTSDITYTGAVSGHPATAIRIQSSDVTIDLNGYTIKGPFHGGNSGPEFTEYGIANYWVNEIKNVTIKNGTVSGFPRGIGVTGHDITIDNVNVIDVTHQAITVGAKSSATITNNKVRIDARLSTANRDGSGFVDAIKLMCSSNSNNKYGSKIEGNTILDIYPSEYSYGGYGTLTALNVRGCENTLIRNNKLTGGSIAPSLIPRGHSDGIYAYGTNNLIVDGNNFTNFGYTIRGTIYNGIVRNNIIQASGPINYHSELVDGGGNIRFH